MRAHRTIALTVAVVLAPVDAFVMLIVHELGHTIVARLAGDPHASFVIYRNTPGDQCIGCNLYNSRALSLWANVAVSLGGVLATALLAVAAVLLVGWRRRPRWCRRWALLELVAVITGGDTIWQLVQTLQQLPIPAREPRGTGLGYTDYSAAVSFAAQASGSSHGAWIIVGLILLGCYLALLGLLIDSAVRRTTRTNPG